jgi:hypothetical protein
VAALIETARQEYQAAMRRSLAQIKTGAEQDWRRSRKVSSFFLTKTGDARRFSKSGFFLISPCAVGASY